MIVLKFTTEYADVFIGTLTQVVGEREKRICQVVLSKRARFAYRGEAERFAGEYKLKYAYEGSRFMPVPLYHRKPLAVAMKVDEEPIAYRRPCLYYMSRRPKEQWNDMCRSLDGGREYLLTVKWDIRDIRGESFFEVPEPDDWDEEV